MNLQLEAAPIAAPLQGPQGRSREAGRAPTGVPVALAQWGGSQGRSEAEDGNAVALDSCGGTEIEAPGIHLSLPGVMSGRITSAIGGLSTGRTTLAVDAIENPFVPPAGSDLFVSHADGAFSLLRIEAIKINGDTAEITLSEPPDFTVEGATTEFKYYPIRTIEGQPTFRIVPTMSWSGVP